MAIFTEKYRPKRIADLRGQDHVAAALSEFVADPSPVAFLFSGDTGTGKTSAALALAIDLGCDVSPNMHGCGGLHEIASGEQTADSIRAMLKMLWNIPMYGSGWKVLIVNECDQMHPQAQVIWLDALEHLPRKTVIVFTTNEPDKLSTRFQDRCQCLQFESSYANLKDAAQRVVSDIWRAETGEPLPTSMKLAGVAVDGKLSFRRLVSFMGQFVAEHKRKAGPIVANVAADNLFAVAS